MGGIFFAIQNQISFNTNLIKAFQNIKYRGQDSSTISTDCTVSINNLRERDLTMVKSVLSRQELARYVQYHFIYGYHSFLVTCPDAMQPFCDPIQARVNLDDLTKGTSDYRSLRSRVPRKLLCNGEIYNYDELKRLGNFDQRDLETNCDVEIILPVYIRDGLESTLAKLDGEFAFVITENVSTYKISDVKVYVARDPLGLKPLYYNISNGAATFVSEQKGTNLATKPFPPGFYFDFQKWRLNQDPFVRYYNFSTFESLDNCTFTKSDPETLKDVYNKLYENVHSSVIKMSSSFLEIGILVSGTVESCAIAKIYTSAFPGKVNLFTISDTLNGENLDIGFTEKFVHTLGSNVTLHVININEIELLASSTGVLKDLLVENPKDGILEYHLFDYIKKNTNVRVVLSGYGTELYMGTHLRNLDDAVFQKTSITSLKEAHLGKLKVTDAVSNYFGIEVRMPFLSKGLLEFILRVHPRLKRENFYKKNAKIEKYILRKTIEIKLGLPEEIVWRQKGTAFTNFEKRFDNWAASN